MRLLLLSMTQNGWGDDDEVVAYSHTIPERIRWLVGWGDTLLPFYNSGSHFSENKIPTYTNGLGRRTVCTLLQTYSPIRLNGNRVWIRPSWSEEKGKGQTIVNQTRSVSHCHALFIITKRSSTGNPLLHNQPHPRDRRSYEIPSPSYLRGRVDRKGRLKKSTLQI